MKSDNKTIAPGIRKRGNTYELNVSAGYDGEGRHIRKYTTFTAPEGISDSWYPFPTATSSAVPVPLSLVRNRWADSRM